MPFTIPTPFRKAITFEDRNILAIGESDKVNVSDIKRGILFVIAAWSGSSQLAFRALCKMIESHDPARNLLLILANIEAASVAEFVASQGDVPQGNGETFWILNGSVIAKENNYTEKDARNAERFTKDLVMS
jgi:hypothetical protein